jgi:hypothetical protein
MLFAESLQRATMWRALGSRILLSPARAWLAIWSLVLEWCGGGVGVGNHDEHWRSQVPFIICFPVGISSFDPLVRYMPRQQKDLKRTLYGMHKPFGDTKPCDAIVGPLATIGPRLSIHAKKRGSSAQPAPMYRPIMERSGRGFSGARQDSTRIHFDTQAAPCKHAVR